MIEQLGTHPFMHIYIANVNWPNDVKARPVLILVKINQYVEVYKVTSKDPRTKSKKIGKNYVPIMLWRQVGLDKASWVDTNHVYMISIKRATQNPPVGQLQPEDISNLFEFVLKKKRNRIRGNQLIEPVKNMHDLREIERYLKSRFDERYYMIWQLGKHASLNKNYCN